MSNILLILKNNYFRLKKDKVTLVMLTIVVPIIVMLGIYFSTGTDITGKIAVVNATEKQEQGIKELTSVNDDINFEFLDNEIEKTRLIRGEYIAQVKLDGDAYKISEFSNKEVKNALDAMINGEVYKSEEVKTTKEAKIVGFLLMFLFFGSIVVADSFLYDRENKIYTRVLQGNVSYFEYTMGQFIYILSVLTIPVIIVSTLTIKLLDVGLGISLSEFAFVILLVGILAASFIILLASLFKNRVAVVMNGSILSMVTSLLAGCLIDVDGQNKFIDGIRGLLPQKRLMDFTESFMMEDLVFILGFIALAIIISICIGRRDYKKGIYL